MLYAVCVLCTIIYIFTYSRFNNNYKRLLDILYLFLIWIIASNNTSRPDYEVYYDFYKYHSLNLGSISEPLYLFLNALFYNLGFSYSSFYSIQIAVSLLLIYYAVDFFEANQAIVFPLFLVFPYPISVVQIRSFLALSIVFLGLTYLYKYYSQHLTKDILVYIICVLVATLIHFGSLFFAICIIPIIVRRMRIAYVYVIGIIAGFILSNVDLLFDYLLPIIGYRKATSWVLSRESFSAFHIIAIIIIRISFLMLVALIIHTKRNEGLGNGINKKDVFIQKESIFLIISILPLELFIQQYSRFSRLYILLIYILFSRNVHKYEQKNKIVISIVTVFVFTLLYYYEYSRGSASGYSMWDTVVRAIFESNNLNNV